MGVNSIRTDNLSPLIPRILNKEEANIFGQFLCVYSSSLIFLIHGYFMTFVSVRDLFLKKYEDCSNVLWRLCAAKLNCKLIKSENEGSSLNLSIFMQKFLFVAGRAMWSVSEVVMPVHALHQSECGLY